MYRAPNNPVMLTQIMRDGERMDLAITIPEGKFHFHRRLVEFHAPKLANAWVLNFKRDTDLYIMQLAHLIMYGGVSVQKVSHRSAWLAYEFSLCYDFQVMTHAMHTYILNIVALDALCIDNFMARARKIKADKLLTAITAAKISMLQNEEKKECKGCCKHPPSGVCDPGKCCMHNENPSESVLKRRRTIAASIVALPNLFDFIVKHVA